MGEARGSWRRNVSLAVGWLVDRPVPRPLRGPLYRGYARVTGADVGEARGPIEMYPNLGAFFVRRLVDGARSWPADPSVLPAPCDGRLQAFGRVQSGSLLQAKGQSYSVAEFLGDAAEGVDLDDALAITIYLSPRDYHRVHCPVAATLARAAWLGAGRYSVAPAVLLRQPRVFVENERVALRMESPRGAYFAVLVGALNVGRLRVVGLEPGASTPSRRDASFRRGEELGRFEMGSTTVLVFPRGPGQPELRPGLEPGAPVRMGQPLARFAPGS